MGERLTKLEARLCAQEWPGLPFEYGKKKTIRDIITAQLAGQTVSDLQFDNLTGKIKTSLMTIWDMVHAEIASSCEQAYRDYREEQGKASQEAEEEEMGRGSDENLKVWCALLGLDASNMDREKLTQAFRLAAIKNHPDKNPRDPYAEARFKNIAEAYEGLSSYV